MATGVHPPVVTPRRSGRGLLLIVVLGIALAAGWAAWAWKAGWFGPERVFDDFPPNALQGYIPADAAAVLSADLRQMRESPVVKDHLMGTMKKILERAEGQEKWIGLVGADPLTDLDALQVVVFPGSTKRAPLWLARGRFQTSRFKTGPGKLQAKVADGFRVYEHRQAGQPVTFVAPAGDYLVISQDRAAVVAALERAAGKARAGTPDPAFQKLLEKVDRQQTLWLAVAFDKVGPVGRLQDLTLDMVLRPVFNHAKAVSGGIHCGKDLTADFHFPCGRASDAGELQGALNSSCEVARGASLVSFGRGTDFQPIIALFAAAQVTRDGSNVRFHSSVPADRLGD